MTSAIRLALRIRRRFTRPATAQERGCYGTPPLRVPVSVVVINHVPVVLDADPADREALQDLGAEVR